MTIFNEKSLGLLGLDLKGIVSRDSHTCFLYNSIDLKFLHLIGPFFCLKISFSCRIFRFSHLSVMSLPCPIQSGTQRQDIFLLVLHRKLIRAPDILSPGLKRASDWDFFYLLNFSAKTTFT
jgi:hypothetical protein